jgi:hypothetical protein
MAAAVALGALCACAPVCGGGGDATPYPDIAAPLATAPVRGENATSYPKLAAPLGTAPVVTPPATAPATTQPAATSTPAPLSSGERSMGDDVWATTIPGFRLN